MKLKRGNIKQFVLIKHQTPGMEDIFKLLNKVVLSFLDGLDFIVEDKKHKHIKNTYTLN